MIRKSARRFSRKIMCVLFPKGLSGRVLSVDEALAADGPGEVRTGFAVIRAAAEILNDLTAWLAAEEVTRRGCLGHFLQAVRAMRFHQSQVQSVIQCRCGVRNG